MLTMAFYLKHFYKLIKICRYKNKFFFTIDKTISKIKKLHLESII